MRDKRMRKMEEQVEEEGDIGCVKRRTLQSDWSKHNARGIQMHCDGKRSVLRWLTRCAAMAGTPHWPEWVETLPGSKEH